MADPVRVISTALTPVPAPAGVLAGPPWLGPIQRRRGIDATWLAVAGVFLLMGTCFFGWRALLNVALAGVAATAVAWLLILAMHKVGRQPADSLLHVLALGLLAGLTLPAIVPPEMALLAGCGVGLVATFAGRAHRLRLHPVAPAVLAVALLPGALGGIEAGRTAPNQPVLHPHRLFTGDVRDASEAMTFSPWLQADRPPQHDALRRVHPYRMMIRHQREMLESPQVLKNMLASGELPRLEEVVLGAVPGPVGGSSAGVVLAVGLALMYLRLAHFTTAAAALLAALAVLLVMPVPLEESTFTVGSQLVNLGPAVAATYLTYLLLASPLVWVALVLAPLTAPLSTRGRAVYGLILGASLILGQWFFHSPYGIYVGLLAASLLARPLDALRYNPFVKG